MRSLMFLYHNKSLKNKWYTSHNESFVKIQWDFIFLKKILHNQSNGLILRLFDKIKIRMATGRVAPIPTLHRLFKIILILVPFKKLNGAGRLWELVIPTLPHLIFLNRRHHWNWSSRGLISRMLLLCNWGWRWYKWVLQ